MKRLLKYLKDYEKECVLGPLFKLLEATFELLVPLVVARIVDKGIGSGDRGYIVKMCAVMIGLGVVGLASSVTAQYFSAVAAVGFSTRLRHTVLEHILNLSYSQADKLGASTMITRMTSDINQVQNGVNLTLRLLLRSPIVVFGSMIMAFTIDVRSARSFVVTIPVLFAIVFAIMLSCIPLYRRVQAKLDGVTGAAQENLSGVRVIRAFTREQTETESFDGRLDGLFAAQRFVGKLSALLNPLTYVVINLAIVAILKTGSVRVDAGVITQGQLIALYNYMSQILVELIKFANLILNITKSVACAGRISQVLETKSSMADGQDALPDGTVVTGKTSSLLGASAALLLNALKKLAGMRDSLHLISPVVLDPIQHLKVDHLGNRNPRLHTDETLIALSICAATNPMAELAMEQLDKLRGCEVHSSVILSPVDEKTFKRLGVNLTCEPRYKG